MRIWRRGSAGDRLFAGLGVCEYACPMNCGVWRDCEVKSGRCKVWFWLFICTNQPPPSLSLSHPASVSLAPSHLWLGPPRLHQGPIPQLSLGRPSDWKQSGLWWHNYPDPLASSRRHNQPLIRLLWASFTSPRRLIWPSDGSERQTSSKTVEAEGVGTIYQTDITQPSIIVREHFLRLSDAWEITFSVALFIFIHLLTLWLSDWNHF